MQRSRRKYSHGIELRVLQHRSKVVEGVSALVNFRKTLEPVWTAFFGFTLAADRLGGLAWVGCAVIMAGIVVAEPAAGTALRRLVGRPQLS